MNALIHLYTLQSNSFFQFHILSSIFLSNVCDKIAYTTRVTPFIVVPGDELDKVGVQLDSSGGIKDARSLVAYEIGGDEGVLSVFDNFFVFALRGLLDDVLDFLVSDRLLSANHKIDDGDINTGNAE